MNYRWGDPGYGRKQHLFEVYNTNGEQVDNLSLCGRVEFHFSRSLRLWHPLFDRRSRARRCKLCWRIGKKMQDSEANR